MKSKTSNKQNLKNPPKNRQHKKHDFKFIHKNYMGSTKKPKIMMTIMMLMLIHTAYTSQALHALGSTQYREETITQEDRIHQSAKEQKKG